MDLFFEHPPSQVLQHPPQTTLPVDEDKDGALRLDTRRHATTHDKQPPLVMPNSVFLSLLICRRGQGAAPNRAWKGLKMDQV